MSSAAFAQLLVGGVHRVGGRRVADLGLHHHQRQAVHEEHDVRDDELLHAARRLHAELVDRVKLISLRLPEVDADIPVAIKEADELEAEGPVRGGLSPSKMSEIFERALDRVLKNERVQVTAQQRKKIKKALDERLDAVSRPAEVAVDVFRVADELSDVATTSIAGIRTEFEASERRERLEATLSERARRDFLSARTAPPRLTALVTTQEIREAGPSEAITRLKVKFSEEAVEWTTIESDKGTERRLIPE